MRAVFLAVISSFLPAFAGAQTVEDVPFASGNYGTMITGELTGSAYADYRLRAVADQEMFVDLTVADTNGNGTIYFNILPPGSTGVAIHIGSIEGNTAQVMLLESGDYTIRVYLMGNDADTGKTVNFNMDCLYSKCSNLGCG